MLTVLHVTHVVISADEAVVLYFVLDKDIGKLTYYLPSLSTD